jgi:hypothetical protein
LSNDIVQKEELPYFLSGEVEARMKVLAGDVVKCAACGEESYRMVQALVPGDLVRAKHFVSLGDGKAVDGNALICPECGMELLTKTMSGKQVIFIRR